MASLFELLAATGLRISETIGLRWSDFVLDGPAPHLQVRRAIVKGAIVAPKSRHGARLIPLTPELAAKGAVARAATGNAAPLVRVPGVCLMQGAGEEEPRRARPARSAVGRTRARAADVRACWSLR